MTDPRVDKLADVLLRYCVSLKKGQTVAITGTPLAGDFIRELYRKSLLMGAHPLTRIVIDGLEEIHFKYSSVEQLKYVSPIRKYEMEKVDAIVSILSSYNTKSLSRVDPKRQVIVRQAMAPLTKRRLVRAAEGKLSWVISQYPTSASAQDAGMSLAEYEDFVFEACALDKKDPIAEWKKISRYNAQLIGYLSRKKQVRVVAPGTDLTYSITGRKWVNCDGKENFPDGEVFTAPLEDSVNGHIRFTYPAVYGGREVEDVRIEFKEGKAVRATAGKGEDFLNAILDTDKGARYVGEAAIGTNFGIKEFTRNTLFDEKIGGTIHLALGLGFPETGSKNHSAIHWDMVCDLRHGGEIYADGDLFFKNGKFLKQRST